ncbi:EscT/YscT/HrcT family type III secretion system export apparatus protein, partial [Burkholderia pseudomallei]
SAALTRAPHQQRTKPPRGEQSTPPAPQLTQVATGAVWTFGGMTFLLGTRYEAYRWWPITLTFPRMPALIEACAVRQTDSL